MAKEDFDALVEPQKNGCPLSPDVFAVELAIMERDNEDIEKLWRLLSKQMHDLKERPSYDIGLHTCGLLFGIAGGIAIGSLIINGAAMHEFPLHLIPLGISGFLIVNSLVQIKKFYSIKKVLRMYQENLAHVASLIEIKEKVMLEKIKGEKE